MDLSQHTISSLSPPHLPDAVTSIFHSSSSIHSTYTVACHGHPITTIVTAAPSMVDTFIYDILNSNSNQLHHLVVGLDIEWRPNFGRIYDNPVATLQLCVGRKCLIFQLLRAPPQLPQSLINFLNNPSIRFVGVGIGADVEKLWKFYNLPVANPVELLTLAFQQLGMDEILKFSLYRLATCILGMDLEKNKQVSLSRWDMPVLSLEQVTYACVDAFASYTIGEELFRRQESEDQS